MAKKSLIDTLKVSSPCTESWDEMAGNNKMRFCSHCNLNVNNISEMTRREALQIVRKSKGRVCVRYIENPETKAPVFNDKLYQIGRRSRIAAGVLGASLAVSSAAYAQGEVISVEAFQTNPEATQTDSAKDTKKEGGTASISGTVTDSVGALIPGATVKIYSTDNSFSRIVTTNDSGFYQVTNLREGKYDLEINADGFIDFKYTNINLNPRSNFVQDTALEVGEVVMMGVVAISYEQPLLEAVSNEKFEEVKNLIANGTDVNVKDKNYDGETALFVAISGGNIKMVETLLNFGADINIKDGEKQTPLMRLNNSATPELVNLLLRYNPKINAVDEEGNNVLHYLAEEENSAVFELLIKAGADINVQNKEGQTPLMIAAYYENLETVKTLLNAGAKVNLRDKDNETALSIAQDEDGEEAEKIVKLLISYGAEK